MNSKTATELIPTLPWINNEKQKYGPNNEKQKYNNDNENWT